MNGELAQAVALVAHGNAALVGLEDISGFEATNSTFQYVRSVGFETPGGRRRRTTIARSVPEWLQATSSSSVYRLSLFAGDGRPVAFANEGYWGILGHAEDRVHAWYGWWDVNREGNDPTDIGAPIWEVAYRMFSQRPRIEPSTSTLDESTQELIAAVTEARDFAREGQRLHAFADWFDEALAIAQRSSAEAPWHSDMLPAAGYSGDARRLLALAERSWVFGGMGSWNDVAFSDAGTEQLYHRVTDRLYRAVVYAVRDAANAFEAPRRRPFVAPRPEVGQDCCVLQLPYTAAVP